MRYLDAGSRFEPPGEASIGSVPRFAMMLPSSSILMLQSSGFLLQAPNEANLLEQKENRGSGGWSAREEGGILCGVLACVVFLHAAVLRVLEI